MMGFYIYDGIYWTMGVRMSVFTVIYIFLVFVGTSVEFLPIFPIIYIVNYRNLATG